jgi:hypothetical protein
MNDKDLIHKLYGMIAMSSWLDRATQRERGSRGGRSNNATRRDAVHKVNPVFRSRNLLGISPAEYRRQHLGAR